MNNIRPLTKGGNMDVQIKKLNKNLNLVKCLNDKATKKFNKIVYNIDDTSTSAVVSAYIKGSFIINQLKDVGLKIEFVSISKIQKEIELEYYNRVRLS